MSTTRPSFVKKEMALCSSPYVYLPEGIPVYTVEVSHRDPIDGVLLQRALDRTLQRMPYLADTLAIDHGAVYYAENPLPMEAAHVAGARHVGGSETNYHMLDLTWDGNVTWFSMFHGFCDGQGLYTFLESVLYHYYCMKDGVEYDPNGIRCDGTQPSEGETLDPYSKSYEVSPDFALPERREQAAPYHLPELVRTSSREVLEYGFRLPSEEFMRFVKENGASPSVILAMLVDEAIRRVHPDADVPVNAFIPISCRRQLGCEETFKNCSSRAALPTSGISLDALSFAERAVQLRAMLKQQLTPDFCRAIINYIGPIYRERMERATDYQEELNKPTTFLTFSNDTFYIDYIGSMHKTGYSDQITDVRFLCKPVRGGTLHLNIIEHLGEFRIACLATRDVSSITDALGQVVREHGIPCESVPVRRFTLPLTALREGLA